MIIGAHSIIYSTSPETDRAFLSDVLGLTHIDAGGGWLIFGLPPSELAVHPSSRNSVHELYLMSDDIQSFIEEMKSHGIVCGPVQNQRWGLLTELTLPGGGVLGVYQPSHKRPKPVKVSTTRKKPTSHAKPGAAKTASRRPRVKQKKK